MNAEAQSLARNWLAKAGSDLKIGRDEMQTTQPATDMVCLHMQQCVEKYLKAYLALHQRRFRRTHDIAELIEQCKEIDAEFEALYQLRADRLTIYGVEVRYPDDFYLPTSEGARVCVEIALAAREFLSNKLRRAGLEMAK